MTTVVCTRSIPITFVALDVLRVDSHDVTANPWNERHVILEELWVDRPVARLVDVFDDCHLLFDPVVEHGLEGSS